jgi:hypothetical protein
MSGRASESRSSELQGLCSVADNPPKRKSSVREANS